MAEESHPHKSKTRRRKNTLREVSELTENANSGNISTRADHHLVPPADLKTKTNFLDMRDAFDAALERMEAPVYYKEQVPRKSRYERNQEEVVTARMIDEKSSSMRRARPSTPRPSKNKISVSYCEDSEVSRQTAAGSTNRNDLQTNYVNELMRLGQEIEDIPTASTEPSFANEPELSVAETKEVKAKHKAKKKGRHHRVKTTSRNPSEKVSLDANGNTCVIQGGSADAHSESIPKTCLNRSKKTSKTRLKIAKHVRFCSFVDYRVYTYDDSYFDGRANTFPAFATFFPEQRPRSLSCNIFDRDKKMHIRDENDRGVKPTYNLRHNSNRVDYYTSQPQPDYTYYDHHSLDYERNRTHETQEYTSFGGHVYDAGIQTSPLLKGILKFSG